MVFFKWQNDENKEQWLSEFNGGMKVGGKWVWREKNSMNNPWGDETFCILTVSVSMCWWWYCALLLQYVTIEEIGVKATWDPVYYILQLKVIKLTQNKKFNKKIILHCHLLFWHAWYNEKSVIFKSLFSYISCVGFL